MFSVVSVYPQGVPYDWQPHPLLTWASHYVDPPPDMVPHCTGTPRHETSLYRTPMLVTSGGHQWRPVQTCFTSRTASGADI